MSLVGREDAKQALRDALQPGRCVSVVGPGGVGKTALVRSQNEAMLVSCVHARRSEEVWSALCEALGLTVDEEPASTVVAAVARRAPTALVLDNVEQIEDIGVVVTALLASPIPLVVTSRRRLRLRHEQVLRLEPLGVHEGVALLQTRCEALGGALEDDLDTRELVAVVDGLPLAIELVASCVVMLGPAETVRQLRGSVELLSDGWSLDDPRHSTLHATVAWSWALADQAERDALLALSAPSGSISVGTAKALLGGNLSPLLRLVDASLLQRVSPGTFRVYTAVRGYLADAHPDAFAMSQRTYADWLAQEGQSLRRAFEQGHRRIDDFAPLQHDLVVAAERAMDEDDPRGCALVRAVAPWLQTRGPATRLDTLLERALQLEPHDWRLLRDRAVRQRTQARLDDAEASLRTALHHAPAEGLADLWRELGVVFHRRRSHEEAREAYEHALSHHRAHGDSRGAGIDLGNLAALAHDTGRLAEAREGYLSCIEALRLCGDRRLRGIFTGNLGLLEQELGDLDAARAWLRDAVDLSEEDRRLHAVCSTNLGAVLHLLGFACDAVPLHRQAAAALGEVGALRSEVLALGRLAMALAAGQEVLEANTTLTIARQRATGLEDPITRDVLRLHEAFVRLAGGADTAAREAVTAATQGSPPLVARSDDARTAVTLLQQALEVTPLPALEIRGDANAFRISGEDWSDLTRFVAARRLLAALAHQHEVHRGGCLDADALFAAGWPGENISSTSANNRVYAALAQLRRCGLRPVLMRLPEGWCLDPQRRIERM